MDEREWIESEGEGEDKEGREDTVTDAELEKMLLQNMSDDDSEQDEEAQQGKEAAKKKG